MRLKDVLRRLPGLNIPRGRYLREQYRKAFDTEEGCVVLQDLYLNFGWDEKSTCVFDKPHATAYYEGQRTVLMHIRKRMGWTESDLRELVETGSPPDPLAERRAS